jgi:hypothetical protein
MVIPEVADDGLAAALGRGEVDDARAAADERVAAEAPALDGLEQERRAAAVAQAEVRPERGDEVGGDDGCRGERVRMVGLQRLRPGSRPARGARPTRSESGRSSRCSVGEGTGHRK